MAAEKVESVDLSDGEMAVVQAYADTRGITLDQAASEMVSLELERRVRRKTKRRPARNVIDFRKHWK